MSDLQTLNHPRCRPRLQELVPAPAPVLKERVRGQAVRSGLVVPPPVGRPGLVVLRVQAGIPTGGCCTDLAPGTIPEEQRSCDWDRSRRADCSSPDSR